MKFKSKDKKRMNLKDNSWINKLKLKFNSLSHQEVRQTFYSPNLLVSNKNNKVKTKLHNKKNKINRASKRDNRFLKKRWKVNNLERP